MFRSRNRRPIDRRGAVLLVVLALLTLFAIAGISFVLYSGSEATASRIHRESLDKGRNQFPDPVDAFNHAVRHIIYVGADDTGNDTLSAFRGHSMAELVYGYDRRTGGAATRNDIPYNGLGAFAENLVLPSGVTIDRRQVINFTRIPTGAPHIIDPEYSYQGALAAPFNVRNGLAGPNPVTGAIQATAVFVGKNAGYTYPDRNNIAVAMIDPVSGRVVVGSYHRDTLFNATNPVATLPPAGRRLAPPASLFPTSDNNGLTNPADDDWIRPAGRYRILRPRPQDHVLAGTTEFPYPPMNPDGTYTGDVQNFKFANGQQRMDSVWLAMNAPVYTYKGRRITPLVAPILIPLDGRVNVNIAGNLKGGATSQSMMGFGPWEQNLRNPAAPIVDAANFTAMLNSVIAGRYAGATPPSPRGTSVGILPFHPDPTARTTAANQTQPQGYASVNFDGSGAGGAMTPPAGLFNVPTYPAAYGNSDATEHTSHPAQFNPYQWDARTMSGGNPNARTFPVSDFRQFSRYAGRTGIYGQTFLGANFADTFARLPYGPHDPAATPLASAIARSLVTPISNARKWPALAPNFAGDPTATPTQILTYTAGAAAPTMPPPTLDLAALATATGTYRDISATTVRNLRAFLSPVNLNRPLADFRTFAERVTTPQPIGPITATAQYTQARNDRQELAFDIFKRLVVLSGASAHYDAATDVLTRPQPSAGGYTLTVGGNPPVAVTAAEYNALRWLAQLAANIVDYIDNDDGATPFVWNPNPAAPVLGDPYHHQNYTGAELPDRVVFGVEKPRLVINEAYAEVANNKANAATPVGGAQPMAFHVRFFVELLNPGSTEAVATSPLAGPDPTNAPGAVALRYAATGSSVYRLRVYDNSAAVEADLITGAAVAPGNVTGNVVSVAPRLTCGMRSVFTLDSTPAVRTAPAPTNLADRVEPNNGNAGAGATRNGFAVIGPDYSDPGGTPDAKAYTPGATTPLMTAPPAPYNSMLLKPADATDTAGPDPLFYTTPAADEPGLATAITGLNANNGHAVVLQRLANPYLRWNDPNDAASGYVATDPVNPYITVDFMTRLWMNDGVRIVNGALNNAANSNSNVLQNYAIGRVQPFAGYQNLATALVGPNPMAPPPLAPTTATMADTLTLAQQPTPAETTMAQTTFFRHNSRSDPAVADLNLDTPFEWLVHMDRRLVNQLELLHVSAGKPHELTYRFGRPAATPTFHWHDIRFAMDPTNTNAPLHRFLEALSVKPWAFGLPDGARVPGLINPNMIWDKRVLQAVLDEQGANTFTAAEVDTIWNNLIARRTPNIATGVVNATVDETGTATDDRPFKGQGVATFAPGSPSLPGGSSVQDTLLGSAVFGNTTQTHPYLVNEPLRKALNSFTPTSDTYLCMMTVGWFEVRNPTALGPIGVNNPVILGREIYDRIPGDLRTQFSAVIDRTNIGVDLDPSNLGNQPPLDRLWATELVTPPTQDATPEWYVQFLASAGTATGVTLHHEGQAINLATGSVIRLGIQGSGATGDDGESFTITGFGATPAAPAPPIPPFDATTGVATVRVSAPPTKTHRIGQAVTGNARFGNPGPQAGFDVRTAASRPVVRFWAQLTP